MYWVSVIIVGIFVIALLWGIVLTLGDPFDKPKHHDSRPGSHYYESNKKRWE